MVVRLALVSGQPLPNRQRGAALIADISGFTPLTEALAGELGPQRGAEEMPDHLARVYGALIAEVHRYRGSVIGFSGDAITCWFNEKAEGRWQKAEDFSAFCLLPSALRAAACGLAMQAVMDSFATVNTSAGTPVPLAIKVAIAVGPVRRFLVGDPQIQRIDVLPGRTMDVLSGAAQLVERGEVVPAATAAGFSGEGLDVPEWREAPQSGIRVAVVNGLFEPVAPEPWPEIAAGALAEEQVRTYAGQAVSIAHSLGDRYAVSRSLGMLAQAHLRLGNYLESFDLYRQALRLDQEIGDRQDEAYKLGNLGYVSLLLGDQAGAQIFYEDALRLSRQIGDHDAELYAGRGLCLLFHQSGDDQAAVQYGEQALGIAQAISDAREQATVWTYLGHARSGLGELTEADEAYQQALALLQAASADDPALEVRAGLARLAGQQGDASGAMEQVEIILPHLATGTLDDADERFRVHLTCYQVLRANNDSRAQEVLAAAVELLQAQANRFDPERRRTFLEKIPAHRELLALWQQRVTG